MKVAEEKILPVAFVLVRAPLLGMQEAAHVLLLAVARQEVLAHP